MNKPNLAEWLLACIDRDASVAVAVSDDPETWEIQADGRIADVGPYSREVAVCEREDHETQTHIARWHPARVLAECAAKRRLVELHALFMAFDRYPTCDSCGPAEDVQFQVEHQGRTWPCTTLRVLAQPYADRPGFDPAWAL